MSILDDAMLHRAARCMARYPKPWAIAGGWAIDLFLGRETRPHADVDIATLRPDQASLRDHLCDLTLEKVKDGTLTAWEAGEELPPGIHEIWATAPDGWQLELLLNDYDEETKNWIYRRDSRVRRPLGDVLCHRDGVPYLTPEIVLLYKAKAPVLKDEADLQTVLPALTSNQRAWLAGALRVAHPGHPWVELLTSPVAR